MKDSNDWTALFQAFAEALEWVLDSAQQLAREYPEEVAAVERVRAFARKRIAGDPAHVRVEDLLFTLGLIAGTREQQRVAIVPTQSSTMAPAAPLPMVRPQAPLPMVRAQSRLPMRRRTHVAKRA